MPLQTHRGSRRPPRDARTEPKEEPVFDRLLAALAPRRVVHAHCDLPCGIYDPEQARIEAESCYKILEKYEDNSDQHFRTRAIAIKEERAELTKHHIDVMWHDYFKPEHVEKFPDLHDVCWQASKQASKVKQSLDIAEAKKLLELIDRIDEMWKATGGPEKTRKAAAVAA
jgi:nickel superoxide dismutase